MNSSLLSYGFAGTSLADFSSLDFHGQELA
jgi:hypothetical protein